MTASADGEAREERVVLVDEHGRDLLEADGSPRTLGKLEAHRRGARHRAVSVFVFDGDRLLLQRRAHSKYHGAGLWTNTCCTHPRAGETALAASARRLAEEMGVRCPLREVFQFTYRARVGADLVEHEFDHVFLGEWQGTPAPLAREVSDWRWTRVQDLLAEIEREPERFTYWLRECLGRVLAARDVA